MVKICRHCKYSYINIVTDEYSCTHTEMRNLVTGDTTDCKTNRLYETRCGTQGRYWVRKEDVDS
jgi:hypothetical protein